MTQGCSPFVLADGPDPDEAQLTKAKLPGNVREVWVPKGKLLAGPMATLLKQDTSIFPLGTITHITRKF